jgi:hypothetical protein
MSQTLPHGRFIDQQRPRWTHISFAVVAIGRDVRVHVWRTSNNPGLTRVRPEPVQGLSRCSSCRLHGRTEVLERASYPASQTHRPTRHTPADAMVNRHGSRTDSPVLKANPMWRRRVGRMTVRSALANSASERRSIRPKGTPTMRGGAVVVQPRPGRTDFQTRRPLGGHYTQVEPPEEDLNSCPRPRCLP